MHKGAESFELFFFDTVLFLLQFFPPFIAFVFAICVFAFAVHFCITKFALIYLIELIYLFCLIH